MDNANARMPMHNVGRQEEEHNAKSYKNDWPMVLH